MPRAPYVHVNFLPQGSRRRVNAEDIVRTLREEVAAGRLPGGSRLPPVPALVAAKRVATLGNPTLIEAALAELLERGWYDMHLASMQAEPDRRYQRRLALLDELMPEGVRWTSPGGGPLVWLEVPQSVALDALSARLAERKVRINLVPGAFHGEPHLHGFPIGYAFLDSARLLQGLEVLAEEIRRDVA